jgi:ATP-dependent DNA ligase
LLRYCDDCREISTGCFLIGGQSLRPQHHGYRHDALGIDRMSVYRECTRYELQAEAEDHAKFVVTGTASAYRLPAMKINPLPAGFVVPAQPVKAPKPPAGADWVHEIKHDGYRIIVRRDGPTVRLYSRNAYDWTVRLAAIAAAARRIKARSFTIDGEAVVLGPDGLSRFEELSRRQAARTAILYAFDLIEHNGEDLRNLHSWIGRPRWRDCCARPKRAFC